MVRPLAITAAALWVFAAGAAKGQTASDIPAILAVGEEQLGQSVGEGVLGGSSVFVVAKGTAKIEVQTARPYALSVQAQAATATEAAALRDAKIEKLRALARRYGVQINVSDANYTLGTVRPLPAAPVVVPIAPVPAPTRPAPPPLQFTASAMVRFTRPPEAAMPAFLDAVHDAGVEQLNATNPDAANPLGALFGLGVGPDIDQAIWDRASTVAVASARQQAEVLAVAGGRHVGQVRQILLIAKSVQGDQATVTVACRFAFAG